MLGKVPITSVHYSSSVIALHIK